MRGNWSAAAWAILVSAFTDGLDGRIARLTQTQSAFGEQYDSMSDLVSFGLAPALLMYTWALAPYGRLAWIVAFLYLACAALRLARFNVLKQTLEKRYFQGCPSPVAACTVASAVLFYQEIAFEGWKSVYMLAIMSLLAATMVSSIRYRSFKDVDFRSQKDFGYLVVIIAILVLSTTVPERIFFPIAITYVVTGAFMEIVRGIRKRLRLLSRRSHT